MKWQLGKNPKLGMYHGITARSFPRGRVWAQLLSWATGQIWLVRWFWQGFCQYWTTPEIFTALSSQTVFTKLIPSFICPPKCFNLDQ